MTLAELYARLDSLMRDGAHPDSPVIVEGYCEDDDFVQASIGSVTTEARCEDDDEHQAIYINLRDAESEEGVS